MTWSSRENVSVDAMAFNGNSNGIGIQILTSSGDNHPHFPRVEYNISCRDDDQSLKIIFSYEATLNLTIRSSLARSQIYLFNNIGHPVFFRVSYLFGKLTFGKRDGKLYGLVTHVLILKSPFFFVITVSFIALFEKYSRYTQFYSQLNVAFSVFI